jgi:hypothetical protein
MSKQVLPLLQTTWGQDGDYAAMVTGLGSWTNDNIGCQCLALAQILFHHRLQPHHSKTGGYTCKKDGEPDRIVSLTFGENYFFPLFPKNLASQAITDSQKLFVESYLFDVAKAFRKNFYGGYLDGPRNRVRYLMKHFDIDASFYYYKIGEAINTPSNRRHEDLNRDSVRTIDDAKLLIKRELSRNRPLWMYVDRTSGGAHAVVVDGFKEDDDGTFYVCVKWGHDSRYNSDPDNPADPPWFNLEGNIGNLDGNLRKFISIRPQRQS